MVYSSMLIILKPFDTRGIDQNRIRFCCSLTNILNFVENNRIILSAIKWNQIFLLNTICHVKNYLHFPLNIADVHEQSSNKPRLFPFPAEHFALKETISLGSESDLHHGPLPVQLLYGLI